MGINKVVYGNDTLIDLTNDTVEANNLLEGATAHDRSGASVTGTAKQGHTIKDGSGTAMTAQPNLQFADAKVTNDAQGQATKVQNFVDINWDDWQEVDDNDDTYYRVTDAPLVDGNIEVDLMKKLWENTAPTASFVAQNITLSSDDYDFLLWIFQITTSVNRAVSIIVKKGEGLTPSIAGIDSNKTANLIRPVDRISDTSFSVVNCYMATPSAQTTTNDSLIPVVVYGIKQKVTISLSAIISNVSTSASKCMLSDGETSVETALGNKGFIPDFTKTVLGSITTQGGSYTATKDCYVIGTITNSNGGQAIVYVNGYAVFATNNNDTSFAFPCKKGTLITVRNTYGIYGITIYDIY